MQESKLRTIGNIHFLKLVGTYEERAQAHASLLIHEIKNGAIPVLAKKNEWLIRRAGGLLQWGPLQESVVFFYHHVLLPFIQKSLRQEDHGMMQIMAKYSGLDLKTFQRAMFQADGLMLLSRTSMMKYLIKDFALGQVPACSSVAVSGDWTKDGRLLVARNQDYPIVGPWEKNTTVMFNYPSEKDQMPFVSIASAGLHTGGLTSMNEAGLTVAAHAHFCKQVSLKGLPIFVVGQEIISKAKTISQAIDIAKKLNRNANWALVVTSAQEKNAAVLEMSPNKVYPRYAQNNFINHTNYFHHPELSKNEAILSPTRMEDDHARWCRMQQILTPLKGSIDIEEMAQVMGDHLDPWTKSERIMGNTLSVMSTIKSVIFDPKNQDIWVSNRGRSPMGLGPFMQVNVSNFWQQDLTEELTENKMNFISGKKPAAANFESQLELYREAYMSFHTYPDRPDYLEKTLQCLKKILNQNGQNCQDGHVWTQAGHVAFKLNQFEEAQKYYQHSCRFNLATHVAQGRDLMLARTFDLLNNRQKALEIYQRLVKIENGPVKDAAKKCLKTPYKKSKTQEVMIDLQFPDPVHY